MKFLLQNKPSKGSLNEGQNILSFSLHSFYNPWRVIVLLLSSLLFSFNNTFAQQTLQVQLGDSIKLEANEYRGEIQWQYSADSTSWENIEGGDASPFTVKVPSFPSYYRSLINEESCPNHYSEVIEVIESPIQYWSNQNTWNNATLPIENEIITIPNGKHIILDTNPPNLGGIIIEEGATLEFERQDLSLTSKYIIVNGLLQIGTVEEPFQQKAILTLNDTDTEAEAMEMGTRGIMVMTGTLELHGATPNVLWTKLDAHAEAGTTTLHLIESVEWIAGEEIVIAPTDYYAAGNGSSVTQRVALDNVNGKEVTIAEGLNAFRWGLLQYPTMDGMSLTQESIEPPLADTDTTTTPLVLDERAEVGLMTRRIVIQAPDDELWNSQGFGVHTMIMPNATAHIEGVEFRRGGQRGKLRRYPFHWHMMSYLGSETLEDATGQYFKKNTINSSANRGVVIHGTNGVLIQDNIIYDVRGHGIFTEDAVERRNVIDGNLVLRIRNQTGLGILKIHESNNSGKGASAFWISNPDNILTNNTAADSQSFGFWLAFPANPWGMNQEVLHTDGLILRPNRLEFGVFDNNTTHSNRNDGFHLDDVEIDNDGNTKELQYLATSSGRDAGLTPDSFEFLLRFALSRLKTWKNMDNGSWDRGAFTDMNEFVSADNCGRFFAGSGSEGVIERCLVVGTSLNHLMNGTDRPAVADFQFYPSSAPTAFATYHSAFSMRNNIVINFPVTEHDRQGVFAQDDYYFRPVDNGQLRNYDNLIINSHPGVKLRPPYGYFTFASALYDPWGHWGPEGNYFVYDIPFMTYGKELTEDPLGSEIVGGVSVSGPFYGLYGFVLHGVGWTPPQSHPFLDTMQLHIIRMDSSFNEVGTWDVAGAQMNWAFQHMRDFATSPDSFYEITFPNETLEPTNYYMYFENMKTEEDMQVVCIPFDGNITNTQVFAQQRNLTNNIIGYSQVNSRDEVIFSDGETWWQDNANNKVWVKLKGGRWLPPSGNFDSERFEQTANQRMMIIIREG